MASEPDRGLPPVPTEEWGAALALLPVAATLGYYGLPPAWQAQQLVQFAPQALAYVALACWAANNGRVAERLGLPEQGLRRGFPLGLLTGLTLGGLNTVVILVVTPSLGYDTAFLTATPHARLPFLVMVPWFICAIAWFVELNFRGFLLGRLAALETGLWKARSTRQVPLLALFASALTFAFDPFMVQTFRHLHWIAVWDGLVWGLILLRTGNLYATTVAHAVEVIVMYCAVRAALLP